MSVTIWHNPRCSKSRTTLALLEDKGIKPIVRLYLEDVPTEDEVKVALNLLGCTARDLMRTGEQDYKDQKLKTINDEAALIAALAATPKLIERPIVFANGKAAVGRPPESVLDIL